MPGRRGTPTLKLPDVFTGDAWIDEVVGGDDVPLVMGTVVFAPGARTFWHVHEGGQMLFIDSGQGIVAPEGETPVLVRPGDVIWVPPGERHWHGATSDTVLVQTAVSFGPTRWESEVTEGEMHLAHACEAKR